MYINRKELKAAARSQIKGNVGTFFGLSLILGIISSFSAITFVGPIILLGPLNLGLSMFIIEVVRTSKGNFETGFNGFKQFGTAFVATSLYIIADTPSLSGYEAIKKSKEIMKGHKWELFVLLLSFFWWYILGAITFGLAYIYIIPYIEATVVNFYEKIKTGNQSAITE